MVISYDAADEPIRVLLNGTGKSLVTITDFSAKPPQILIGQRTQLCYEVTNAISASIAPEVEPPVSVPKGCHSVKPRQSTTYTLTAIGHVDQKVSREVTVKVKVPPRPIIISFSADPQTTSDQTQLCYKVINADSVSIEPGLGEVEKTKGKHCYWVSLNKPTTYTLTVKGRVGKPIRKTITVNTQYILKVKPAQ